jgi:transcriptional regulator with XRE-family HTH domain
VYTRLKAARQARQMSQAQVIYELEKRARAAGVYVASGDGLKTTLSRFENGHREVSEPYRSLFRAIYGMTDDELFAPAAVVEVVDAEYLALARRIEEARTVTVETAVMLSHETHRLRTLDCSVGGASLVDRMNAHLKTIQDALSHVILPSIRRPLAAVLADTAALAAWQALDVGAINRAWRHHETARYAALEARDPVLLTHAMAQQAFVLVDVGDVAAARSLVVEARLEAGTAVPTRFRAWLAAAEGEINAAAGLASETDRSFDAAQHLIPGGPYAVEDDMPFIVLNHAQLSRWRGNAFAQLGSAAAIDDLRVALEGEATVSHRAAASLRCDLALALARAGELDEARLHAIEARRLARTAGSVRQRKRIEKLISLV